MKKPIDTRRLQMYLMETSANYSKFLSSLHNLHKVIIDDPESATMVEDIIYTLDKCVKMRQYLRDKYQLSKFRID